MVPGALPPVAAVIPHSSSDVAVPHLHRSWNSHVPQKFVAANAATSTLKASATPGITQASTDTGQEDAFLGSLHQTRVRERLVIEAMEMK